MNLISIGALTFNGRTFYTFATSQNLGDASAIAGAAVDYLTDQLGDGFGYQVNQADFVRSGPAGDADARQLRDQAAGTFHAQGEQPNPPPTAAICITPDQARFIASALEVGADDESHAESDYQAAREVIAKLETVQAGGSVVIQVQP